MAKLWPWRRRSEGFEWHKYVRTTIALRREHRREKAEEIKRSAAEGAARAADSAARFSRQSASAASDGALRMSKATGRGLKHFAAASSDALRRGSAASVRGLRIGSMYAGAGLNASGRWIGRTSASSALWTGGHLATAGRFAGAGLSNVGSPLLDFLGRPGVSGPLMLAGGVAYFAFLAIFPAIIAALTLWGLVADPETVAQQVRDLSAVLPGMSPCGRTNVRLRGWMGRADQVTKIRGMFVHPVQVSAAVKKHPAVGKARLVVDRAGDADDMVLEVEVADASALAQEALLDDLRNATKLRGRLALLAPGTLPDDAKTIEDRRPV